VSRREWRRQRFAFDAARMRFRSLISRLPRSIGTSAAARRMPADRCVHASEDAAAHRVPRAGERHFHADPSHRVVKFADVAGKAGTPIASTSR